MIPSFSVVCGVDARHLRQLATVWPTWRKNKGSTLLANPMVVFYEREQVRPEQVRAICDHPQLSLYAWPPKGVVFAGDNTSKWDNQQRHKMLAGYIYIPTVLKTEYFLKIDTDAIAVGQQDWIDPAWFVDRPAIISHPWGFTRPADQMLRLDAWVEKHYEKLRAFQGTKPLNLTPRPGEDRVCHKRIGSWCAFFRTDFNYVCAEAANASLGQCQIPVASQDGFTWYCATRLGEKIIRTSMKKRGWQVFSTDGNVTRTAQQAMKENDDGRTAPA